MRRALRWLLDGARAYFTRPTPELIMSGCRLSIGALFVEQRRLWPMTSWQDRTLWLQGFGWGLIVMGLVLDCLRVTHDVVERQPRGEKSGAL